MFYCKKAGFRAGFFCSFTLLDSLNIIMIKKALFAAGCFWGVEEVFREIDGVISTRAGYTGGTLQNPTYEDVCTDTTGHAEAVEIIYDSAKISYTKLLEIFWNSHDPTTLNRQGPDKGTQYRSAVFYYDENQKLEAEKMKSNIEKSARFSHPVVTQIMPAAKFYPAEEYHQKYLLKKGKKSCNSCNW